MKKYIFLLIALLSSLSTWAVETYKTGTITYKVYDTAETPYATVYQDSSSVKKLTGTVTIPASITYNEKDYPVTKIERWYYGNEVDLVLPSSIKQESDVSWSYFSNLNSLTLPENATFTQFSLSNVRKPFGELIIPKTITSIVVPTSSSYGGSWNVRAYKVDAANPNYKSTTDGVLLSNDESVLVTYPYKKEGVSYTIPANVTTIGDYAFYNNDNLETVILPSGVTTIGNRSFYDCGALYKCEIPVTVTSIGVYAFYACNKLSVCDITPLTALQTIGQYAFYNCKLNTSNNTFTLPANLKTIGSYAFYSAFDNNYNVTVEFPSTLGESGSQVKLDGYVFNNYTIRSYMNNPVECNSNDAFYYVSRIYIPAGTTSTYKAKTGWGYGDGSKLMESASLDIDDNLVAPTITQILDAENELVSVKLSSTSTESGAKILYRIFQNGAADVDVSDWYTYNGTDVFPMDNLSTIKARTTKGGKYSAESQYTVDISSLRCPAPDIITAANSKTMTMATTVEGGSIYYTTNNTTPSKTNGTKYTGQITLDGNFYYQAIVVKDGMFSSTVTAYTVNWFKCKTPEVSYQATTPDGSNVNVVLTSDEPGVTLKYRSDGSSEFMPYTGPVTTSMNSYFYYMATKPNYQDSDAPSIYTYRDNIKCDKPVIAVDQTTKLLTLSAPEGVSIYYTLNGVDPTVSADNKYAGSPITITGNCQIKAIAHKSGWFQSEQAYVNINNWFVCPNVVIEQVFENGLPKMKLSLDETTGVDLTDMKIYYLVGDYYTYEDGWRSNGQIYSGPVEVESGYTIYAVAIKDGYIMSNRSSKRMDYSAYTRCASPSVEIDNEKKTVTMSTDETNGKVYYTLDGTTPTTASTLYESPFTSEVNCTIKAITARDPETVDEVTTTYANSYVVERNLDDWFRVQEVIFQPVLGDAEGEYKMALIAEEGAEIYYGINQGANILYTDTFAVSAGDWVYALARKDGYVDSYERDFRINEDNYQVRIPNVYLNDVTREIVVTPVTYGSTIYYTYDKSDPDPTSSSTFKVEKDTIKIVRNGTYKFIAVKDRMTKSSVQTYNINWFRVPDVTITPIVQDNVLKVKLECEDADAIYYGINEYESEAVTANANYTEPFEVNDGAYVYASAVKDGYDPANWTSYGYIYKSNYTCATPTITVAADTTVTIASSGENETIYYTLNGDDPTTSSTMFTSKFKLQSNAVIKAIAVASDKLNSAVRTREYTGFRVSSVVITPIVVDNKLKVKLTTPTPGAKIYYAINENNPTTTLNMNYTEPFDINNGDYIYANAVKEGYTEAGWSTHSWIYYNEYTCSEPTITIKADTAVVISANEGATIYYTLDGTDPTTSSTKYTSEFKLQKNGTIKAIAIEDGKMNSGIRERVYNGFNVRNIDFALDGIKMTLTSETPGVTFNYCYENDPREEVTGNLVYSRTYTGPFDMEYNGYIYVRASRDGYNPTESNYWVSGLVKWTKPEASSFDGHKLVFKDIPGAQIWYTTNGDYPEANYRSTLYKDSILISNTGVIRAIAVGDYKNQSDIAEIEIKSFASETGAVSDKAGGLADAMAWKGDLGTITDYTITGPINSDDMAFIKDKMTSLQTLDLSGAQAEGGIIPDNAFAGMPLVMFSSPNALQSVGHNIFSGCKELAAVVWNTTAKIPNDAFDKDVNPNLLVFVPAEDAAPNNSSARNIIVNNTADHIYLSDGADNNFYSPKQFYTKSITYTHDFKLTTGSASGWETICLPFDCSYFVHESKGELKPFAEYDGLSDKGSYKPFWLRELTDIGFKDVKQIEANKPYIISMPNNDGYATRYRVGGKVTFSASNVYVPQTVPGSAEKGDVTLYANFMNSSETSDMLLLNTEASADHEAGSIFVLNSGRAVRPFEAYVISRARSRAYISVGSLGGETDDEATAIKERTIDDGDMVKVYNLSGVLVKQSTKEDALKGLAKGVYIVNGKRVMVK